MTETRTFNKEEFIKDLEDLTVVELRELVSSLEDYFGITAAQIDSINNKIRFQHHREKSMQIHNGRKVWCVKSKIDGLVVRSKNRVQRTKK